jgi:DNA-binding transcriptional ArsR family regulator
MALVPAWSGSRNSTSDWPSSTLTLRCRGRTAELASGFGALADPDRQRVLGILAASPEGEVCVCDVVESLAKGQPTASLHLKILSEPGLVHGDQRASGSITPSIAGGWRS